MQFKNGRVSAQHLRIVATTLNHVRLSDFKQQLIASSHLLGKREIRSILKNALMS